MTIPFPGDKIAPVADDGASKSRRESGQPETRRRNSRGMEVEEEEPEALKKQMKKTVDNALQM